MSEKKINRREGGKGAGGSDGSLDAAADSSEGRQRIAKVLSRRGVASRRGAEAMIAEGRIKVAGKVITTPATLVAAGDEIMVDGKVVAAPPPLQFFLFHKPRGVITTMGDDRGRACLADLLPKNQHHLKTIGRLDYNSEGLLVLTNDGAVKRQWEHPKNSITRGYRVRVFGRPSTAKLAQLARGITIDGFAYRGIGAQLLRADKTNCWLAMELTEGKNREIRRVMAYLGHEVSRLIRVSYGHFQLGDLPPGQLRPATAEELAEAQAMTDLMAEGGNDLGNAIDADKNK